MSKTPLATEELYQGQLNAAPRPGPDQRLFIDLDVCRREACGACEVGCSYYAHVQAPGNNGIRCVSELAAYALVCRRCSEPHCVKACPHDALEQQKEKGQILVRHPLRCVSCKSCSHACPYGTIYPDQLPHLLHNCDFCLDRRDQKDEPLCVKTCSRGALALKGGDLTLDENTFLVGDHLIVHSSHWRKEKA